MDAEMNPIKHSQLEEFTKWKYIDQCDQKQGSKIGSTTYALLAE